MSKQATIRLRRSRRSKGIQQLGTLFLILTYGLFVLLPCFCPDVLPKGARVRLAPGLPSPIHLQVVRAYGSDSNISGWIDDEEDACHSSPDENTPYDNSSFALLDFESKDRKGAEGASHACAYFPLPADEVPVSSPAPASLPLAYAGPCLPFPEALPAFLISSLPPPLPA